MKMKVVQQNLEKSDFIEAIVAEKIERVLEKFPEFSKASATISISMENSHEHSRKDHFNVKLVLVGAHKRPFVIHKAAANPYAAAAILADRLLHFLSRANDKIRVKRRHLAQVTKHKQKWLHYLEAA